MSHYMLLINYDPTTPSDGSPSRQPQHAALEQRMREKGHYRGGAGLLPVEAFARRVRHSTSGVLISEGPFAETKEVLGGYFEVECTYEEALSYAEEIGVDNRSWVDVRRVFIYRPQ